MRPFLQARLNGHPVSRRVNDVRNDGPELVDPVEPPAAVATQGQLF